MSDFTPQARSLFSGQKALRAKCFHPAGGYVEFEKEEIEQSIPKRFEQIVRLYPNRLAVKSACEELTFSQLNDVANRIANTILRERGKKSEPVALLCEQGVSAIVSILGLLKAGKFYVPLDPALPIDRMRDLLADSKTDLVLTNSRNLAAAGKLSTHGYRFINTETVELGGAIDNPELSITPESLAYIVYTSGSTGRPKGVAHSHRYVLYHVFELGGAFHICPEDRISLIFPWSFSGGAHIIYSTLLHGAALFPFDVNAAGLGDLTQWLIEQEITIYHSTAAVLREALGALSPGQQLPSVRLVRFGGETVTMTDLSRYKDNFSRDCLMINSLATTECGIICRYFFDKDTPVADTAVPVGYAAEGKEIMILDDDGNPVACDQIGEIAVKGRYLSEGYWGQPDLTAAKFLPDPDGGDERIYLTGDLGRMSPDGCLYHLGRKDLQVKVRGYRVELAEVEAALLQHEDLKEVTVVGRDDQAGNTQLVAYVVGAGKHLPNVGALRKFLSQKLPAHMIPSNYVVLDALPLTANGKIMRQSLPVPPVSRSMLDIPFVAPRNSIEEKLAAIWAQVLALDQVGVADNFFDLGGQSLSATRVVTQVIKQFHLEIPLQSLFESPTVAAMAAMIEKSRTKRLRDDENLNHDLAELESLPEDDAKKLLPQRNRSHSTAVFVEFPREEIEQSVSERFEKIVKLYPDRLAVKAGHQTLTYDALNKMANRIARTLLESRRQSRETVALLFDHGVHVIAALLGAIKAGELIVVLDFSSPRGRNDHLLANCNPSLILTDNRNLDLARRLAGSRVLLNIEEMTDSHSADNLVFHSAPDEIAIVNYTTGSTGEPKGVAKTHLELLDSCFTQINMTQISPRDRISLLHSLRFSTAYTNLLAALMSGASIFPFDIQAQGIQSFVRWLQEEQITMCHLPPGVFRQLADSHSGRTEFPHLRLIRLSGSLIKKKDFELYKKTFPDSTRLMISMGSTESRGICSAVIDQTFFFPGEGTPLGYPVPGKKILLLDEHGREVPCGQMGEIAVQSRYLTTGYWKQPEPTGSEFVSDPEAGKERIHLTGDLGRMMPDGFLIHLGRKDFMVKIRGYRVSFNEVESALLEHPAVKETAVSDWDDNRGEKSLAAYVVCAAERAVTVSELVRFLRTKLPRYMIPASFVFLENLPHVNGKIDRRSLPRPEPVRPNLDQAYAAPVTAAEKELVLIWEEVLGLGPIGIRDNFFELGGHSLAAMRIVLQVIKKFGLELPLKFLFESPTISAMALVVAEHRGKKINEHEIHSMLAELETLTDEEAQCQLSAEIKTWRKGN